MVLPDGPGFMRINFPTVPGKTYTLQQNDTLAPNSWVTTNLIFNGDGTTKGFRLPTTTPNRRYFRVVVGP